MKLRSVMKRNVSIAMIGAFMFAIAGSAAAKGIAIGAEVPDVTLKDCNGVEHTLSQYRGKIVVLEFSAQGCPWSRGTDPSIIELAKKYSEKGVVFLGIDSDKGNTPEQIKEYAEKTGVSFPILKDQENKYADVLGAMRTPEIYIVDKDGKLAYHGAYDNRTAPDTAGDVPYTANALDEMIAGKDVSTPKVSAWGCSISRVAKATE